MKTLSTLFSLFVFSIQLILGQTTVGSDAFIYTQVEVMPKLKPAANCGLATYFEDQVTYSTKLKLQGVEGNVWVRFVVDEVGRVSQVKIEKSINNDLDVAIKEVIESSGLWKPGMLHGKKVSTQMSFSLRFALSPAERDLFNQLKALDKQTNHPLYVLNNDVLKEKLNLDELNIKSVKVLTGANALEKYGDAAKNGVVVVSSK